MMINFKNKSVDLLVSPDHKMLYSSEWIFYKSKNKRWLSKPAYQIKDLSKIIIPQAGIMEGKEIEFFELEEEYEVSNSSVITKTKKKVKIKGDTFIKLLAIYLAEGSFYIENGKYYKVRIVQKEGEKAEKIREILEELPFKYFSIKRKNGTIEFVINSKVLTKYMKRFGKSEDKFIPEEIFSASQRQKKLFLEYFILGDGYKKPDGKTFHFVSKSKKLIDGIQAIYATLGIATTVYDHKYKDGKVYYRLEIRKDKKGRDKYYSMVREVKDVPYNDYIYSVTVPEGYIMVRRNGKIAISGNCMSMRGVKNPSSYTVTSKLTGVFMENEKTRNEFLNLIYNGK
ncbi:LAGLIDADG family homing endonuclease [Persephonella hydrogeniphila]